MKAKQVEDSFVVDDLIEIMNEHAGINTLLDAIKYCVYNWRNEIIFDFDSYSVVEEDGLEIICVSYKSWSLS